MEGLLTPEKKEVVLGEAEVRQTFKIAKVGTIAGCFVRSGVIPRTARVRVIRDGDRKSTRLKSSHSQISYAVFCLKKKKNTTSGPLYDNDPSVDRGCRASRIDLRTAVRDVRSDRRERCKSAMRRIAHTACLVSRRA